MMSLMLTMWLSSFFGFSVTAVTAAQLPRFFLSKARLASLGFGQYDGFYINISAGLKETSFSQTMSDPPVTCTSREPARSDQL